MAGKVKGKKRKVQREKIKRAAGEILLPFQLLP
jgi:hypothetical protein